MRGKDIQDEAGEVGKGHITQGPAGYKEDTGFYSWWGGKPLQGSKERSDW